MRKIMVVIMVTVLLTIASAVTVMGNSWMIGAENGMIQAPATLGVDMGAIFGAGSEIVGLAVFRYGIAPTLTVAGEFSHTFPGENQLEQRYKLYFSPFQGKHGYTAYVAYNPLQQAIPMYGVSLWIDAKALYAFCNLELGTEAEGLITPGLGLRLGGFGIGAEGVFDMLEAGSKRISPVKYRVGCNYKLFRGVYAKASMETGFTSDTPGIYRAGLAIGM